LKQTKKMNDRSEKHNKNKNDSEVKIKYDIITPEERDPQPKAYDEIEY
jgi:hypothetical protein